MSDGLSDRRLTLGAYENERHLGGVAVVRHLGVVAVDGVKTHLVLETEDKDDCVHPMCELKVQKAECNTLIQTC